MITCRYLFREGNFATVAREIYTSNLIITPQSAVWLLDDVPTILTGLWFFCCSFTQIPPQVLELANLSDLYMASNQIESVPEDIHRLQR